MRPELPHSMQGWRRARCAVVVLAAAVTIALVLLLAGARTAGADADGLGAGTPGSQTTTAPPVTGPITNLTPTIVAAPNLVLLSVRVSGDRVKLRFACAFAACKLAARLATSEHLRSGRTNSLSASGHAKHTRTVRIGSSEFTILPGKTGTLLLKLNATGMRLLESFDSIPASAMIALTNGQPVTTIKRTLRFASHPH